MKRISPLSAIVMLALAILAATAVYLLNNRCGLTLTVLQQADSAGRGSVSWDTGGGYNDTERITYSVAPGVHQYRLHLPAAGVRSMRLVPLAGGGQTTVFRLGLLGESVQYLWGGDGACLQQQVGSGLTRAEACRGDSPTVSQNPDGTVQFTNIPDKTFAIPLPYRLALAGAILVIVLAGGYWLVPLPPLGRFDELLPSLGKAAWLLVGMVFSLQMYRLVRFAMDVPYLDEWTYFSADAFTGHWLFDFHNEHRIVLTKLMAWLNLKLFGLNFFGQQLVNYLGYGVIVATVALLKRRMTGPNFPLFPLFALFLLSPLNMQNHLWGFQSQFHLVVAFTLLALIHSFSTDESPRDHAIVALCALLAAYSFSAGVVLAVLLLAANLAFILAGRRSRATKLPLASLLPYGVLVAGLGCWFIGYRKPPHHPDLALPFSAAFWDYFLNVVGFGFGIRQMSAPLGGLCLLLVVTPLVLLWWRRDPEQRVARWRITATIGAILAFLTVISMGRAGIGVPKASRYTEFGLLLIPFAAVAWHLALPRGRVRGCLLTLFLLFCAITTSPYWSDRSYRDERARRLATLECVGEYYAGRGDGACEEGYKRPIPDFIDGALRLDASFTRQFTRKGENRP